MAFAAVGLVAFGTSGNSLAQNAPGPQGTPPPPPVPASSPLISTSPEPTSLPSNESPPTVPPTTPTPEPFSSPSAGPEESSSPQARGRRGHRGAVGGASPSPSPSETPEPPQFSNLNGVWEIALQPLNGGRTTYSHLYVTQDGNTLTGTWRRTAKAELPFTGTFDGRLFKIAVTEGAVTEQLSGYEENYSDMVGLYTDGDPKHQGTPFTAAHRKPSHDRGVNIAP
jgi:hypothetical protein